MQDGAFQTLHRRVDIEFRRQFALLHRTLQPATQGCTSRVDQLLAQRVHGRIVRTPFVQHAHDHAERAIDER